MLILLLIATGALLIIAMTMMVNLILFPKVRATESPIEKPLVSILVPARNEAEVIERTVSHLLAQSYQNIEVLILDDQSEDGTGELARKAGKGDERLRVIEGRPLPDGWMGKSWACQTLGEMASGEILVFTDADVIWQTGALDSVLYQMQSAKVDMVTVFSTLITKTLAERWTVSNIAMVMLGYLPIVMVHYSPFSAFAAANGQMMAWKRDAYDSIGGHTIVANNVLDDVTLAKAAKKHGYRIRIADGNGQISTRMYDDWHSVRSGFAKNILAGYGGVIPLLLGTLFHWLIFILPYVALLIPQYRLWGAALIILGIVLRGVSAVWSRQRVLDALFMPITVVLFTIIAFQSIYWHTSGGYVWKGRKIS